MNIAPYISLREYACKCCDGLPVDLYGTDGLVAYPYGAFFEMFRQIRLQFGNPITINCGFRCPMHNAAVGGERCSEHLWGLAMDLACPDEGGVNKLVEVINQVQPDLRVGIYTRKANFVHIGVGYLIRPRMTSAWSVGVRWYG